MFLERFLLSSSNFSPNLLFVVADIMFINKEGDRSMVDKKISFNMKHGYKHLEIRSPKELGLYE